MNKYWKQAGIQFHLSPTDGVVEHDADVNLLGHLQDDSYRYTPLHHAIKGGNIEVVRELLKYNANIDPNNLYKN